MKNHVIYVILIYSNLMLININYKKWKSTPKRKLKRGGKFQ